MKEISTALMSAIAGDPAYAATHGLSEESVRDRLRTGARAIMQMWDDLKQTVIAQA